MDFLRPHLFPPDWIPTGIDKCNKKIMGATIRDPDLFRVAKRLGINPLVKRCGINPALRSLVLPIMMRKLVLDPE
jgi:hypothetical protein